MSVMSSALALTKKNSPQSPDESAAAYEDRMIVDAMVKLHYQEKRNAKEQEEYKELKTKFVAVQVAKGGYIPAALADAELRIAAGRLHEELSAQFGPKTPLKTLLIDRLVCAWNMAISYEKILSIAKYKQEDDKLSYSFDQTKINMLKETRKGIESANEQIVRLAQTLQHLVNPPLQVRATNAFFAQNQQVNQAVSPKDLEKSSDSLHAPSAR